MRSSLCFFAALLTGCGLVLDLQPPDDAGLGGFDAAARDGGLQRVDGGPDPIECTRHTDCDDGDPCNGVEYCDEATSKCATEAPPSCDDGDACTVDACEDGACVHEPVDCEDGVACTEARCDPDTGECRQIARDELCPPSSVGCLASVCDVALGCTSVDLCEERDGVCDPAANGCRFDSCEAACAPIGPCSVGAHCEDGVCVQEPALAGEACRVDACRAGACTADGVCVTTFVDCDDGEPCTVDSCDPSTGCVHGSRPDGADCDLDADLCTVDLCEAGTCTSGLGVACVDTDTNPCTARACDPLTGGCVIVPAPGDMFCAVNASCVGTSCECGVGFDDCNGDGDCDCNLDGGFCGVAGGGTGPDGCTPYMACPTCPAGQTCCPCTGACVADTDTDCTTPLGVACPLTASP